MTDTLAIIMKTILSLTICAGLFCLLAVSLGFWGAIAWQLLKLGARLGAGLVPA